MSRVLVVMVGLTILAACGSDATTNLDPDPVPSRITLSETGLDFAALEETAQVSATVFDQNDAPMTATVSWSIADGAVATVVGGLVTAAANGSTTLTAAFGVVSSTIGVDVDQVADTIVLSTTDVQFNAVGDTLRLSADVLDAGGSSIPSALVIWTQDDASVATVSGEGLITSEGAGNTTVSAASDGATSEASVGVTLAVPSEIVFTSQRDGDYEVYVMDADGSNQVNLTNSASDDWNGMAEPGGGRVVVFATDRDGDFEIYAMDRDAPGSPPQNLTNDPRTDNDPAWSWDASKIAFIRADTIWVMDPDGANAASLGVQGRNPAWSPDGSRIAYIATSGSTGLHGVGALYVMNADGSSPVEVYPPSGSQGRLPEWSPDGSTIVFFGRLGASGGTSVFTVEPDGSNFASIQGPIGARSVGWPTWSPDGSEIAYSGPESSGSSEYNIWIMQASGAGDTMITTAVGVDFHPRWIR